MKGVLPIYLAALIAISLPLTATCAADKTPATTAALAAVDNQALEDYAYLLGKQAYIWGWPAVNVHNRREGLKQVPAPGLNGGVIPVAPVNHLAMLTDYVKAHQRSIVTPNQDTVYGSGFSDLAQGPVIIQIPEIRHRYWILQLMDAYTDVFAAPGSLINSKPGFYLLVGPDWRGQKPKGVVEVVQAPTNLVWYVPRLFMKDTAEDRAAIQPIVNQINAYPLSQYDGKMKVVDWKKIPVYPEPVDSAGGEVRYVRDESFWDDLAAVLAENRPRPGEAALVENFRRLLGLREKNPAVQRGLDHAVQDGAKLVNSGFPYSIQADKLGHHWAGELKAGAFGSDYLSRAWVAKAYIAACKKEDAFYIGTDYDGEGNRLNGGHRYSLTFPKGGLPPAKAFWSLTLYDREHFFVPNALKRYSMGTKNLEKMTFNPDGSLTLYFQHGSPGKNLEANWLPAPEEDFSLLIRFYNPSGSLLKEEYQAPPVKRVD